MKARSVSKGIRVALVSAIDLTCAMTAGAIDVDYSISVGPGAAMALGGDMIAAVQEFGASLGAEAFPAPVMSGVAVAGVDIGIFEPFRAVVGLEARRLGFAVWAPDAGADLWMALWTAGLRIGLRYRPSSYYLGLGGLAIAPIGDIALHRSLGDAGLSLTYGAASGKALALGAYLEGGLILGLPVALGPVYLRPRLGAEAGLWPGGLLDGTSTWQAALSIVMTLDIERRLAR
jgi:hypothetical protein